jgi:hypothetical protein
LDATHTGHGDVPVMDPLPKYPAWHMQSFCDVDSAPDWVFCGHAFRTPAAHHDPWGHGWQSDEPLRKYPALHTHGQLVAVVPTPV